MYLEKNVVTSVPEYMMASGTFFDLKRPIKHTKCTYIPSTGAIVTLIVRIKNITIKHLVFCCKFYN